MVVGKGKRSGNEYTAEEKLRAFKEVIKAVVTEKRRIEDLNGAIKDTIDYWCDEYTPDNEDPKEFKKEAKKLFNIRIAEAMKDDKTTRNAFELEMIMEAEAEGK